jgi:hypothetical protein
MRVLGILEYRTRRDVARVVDTLAIGGVGWLTEFFLELVARPFDQLDATATRDMI